MVVVLGVQDNILDSTTLGGPGNVACPSGFSLALNAAFIPKINFLKYDKEYKDIPKTDLYLEASFPAVFVNNNLDLLAKLKSTILTGKLNLIQLETDWYNSVINAVFKIRNDRMFHSYADVSYVGDESCYCFYTSYVGIRISSLVPSYTRTYTLKAGETISELAQIYPSAVMDIIIKYGEYLGFIIYGEYPGGIKYGYVKEDGKMFIHTGAYNTSDLEVVVGPVA